jgi:hypothetical protein
MVNHLKDIVIPGEKYVCVFTNQKKLKKNLDIHNNGVSKSGIWKLDTSRMIVE